MAIRRRDQIPPYEIMRSRGNAAPGTGASAQGQEDAVERSASERGPWQDESLSKASSGGSSAPWWVGSSAPLVLRIPRGIAVAVVVGLLGLLVLAYWVGSTRGASAALAKFEETNNMSDVETPRRVAPAVARQSSPTGSGTADSDQQDQNNSPILEDRRKPGLNYLRLQSGNFEDGKRLSDFMADKGVTIQLYETRGGQWIVYAVDRGFRADELKTETYLAYRRKLMNLGRAWKQFNNNRGTDLGTMYPELYSG